MNKKQLYESIMKSVAKEVKKTLNEAQKKYGKHEFSPADLKEIRDYILEDDDFYEVFCKYVNFDYFDSYEEAVEDLMSFLSNDIYGECEPSEAHEFYILDEPDYGTSWMELKSGKLVNLDNLYVEFKSIVHG